jgi:hypothetical protein
MESTIHGDMTAVATADTNQMEWTPSPSGSVHRKRVHLVGLAESGQVTSVVRYEPMSKFPPHDHPEGEEILVLEGVFSDEHGDWPAGTYLLNPEGFRHSPFSDPGCVIFVKLRQFAGLARKHVVLETDALGWEASAVSGVTRKRLYEQPGFPDVMRLERWEPGTAPGRLAYDDGAELFVIEGEFSDEFGLHSSRAWVRLPAGSAHRPRTEAGCTVYIKAGGVRSLRSAAAHQSAATDSA